MNGNHDNKYGNHSNQDDGDDDMGDESDEDVGVDDHLRQTVKAALGSAAAESDKDEEVSVDQDGVWIPLD